MKIYFTAWRKNGSKRTWLKPTSRRIRVALASGKYEKYYLKVEYGKQKDAYRKIVMFSNEIKGNKDDILWGVQELIKEYENTC